MSKTRRQRPRAKRPSDGPTDRRSDFDGRASECRLGRMVPGAGTAERWSRVPGRGNGKTHGQVDGRAPERRLARKYGRGCQSEGAEQQWPRTNSAWKQTRNSNERASTIVTVKPIADGLTCQGSSRAVRGGTISRRRAVLNDGVSFGHFSLKYTCGLSVRSVFILSRTSASSELTGAFGTRFLFKISALGKSFGDEIDQASDLAWRGAAGRVDSRSCH